MSARIWIVDDDRSVRFVLATALREAGYTVSDFDSVQAALTGWRRGPAPDLLFTDVRMPGDDGLVLLRHIRSRRPDLPVIVMSAYTDVASTAGAFRGGAFDYLSKPFDLDHAVALAQRALAAREGQPADDGHAPASTADQATAAATTTASALVGDSPAMRTLFRSIGRLAQLPLSVLVTGETGTGKELVARALHRESPRAQQPFIALNTAAIPAELLESELFGHEAGAFTGANRRHVGRFEQADGGTLFLDEIGDMPLPLQTRLLRVLAEDEFFRVGGRELIQVDVRVIAATHQPLEMLVEQGRFRADLLHRLDVVRLALPPLRERREDIAQLAAHFLALAGARLQSPPKRLGTAAVQRLQAYAWPGNVRELENLCWRLAALAPGERIGVAELEAVMTTARNTRAAEGTAASAARGVAQQDWERLFADWARAQLQARAGDAGHDPGQSLHAQARARMEQALFEVALAQTNGHRGEAAALLGLGRNTLARKLGSGRKRR